MTNPNYTHTRPAHALTCGQCRKWRNTGDPRTSSGCCTARTELEWGIYPQWLYQKRAAFDLACSEIVSGVPF